MAANNNFGYGQGGTQYSANYQGGFNGNRSAQSYNTTPRQRGAGGGGGGGQAGYSDSYGAGHVRPNANTSGFGGGGGGGGPYSTRQQQQQDSSLPANNVQGYGDYGFSRSSSTAYEGTKTYYPSKPQQHGPAGYSTGNAGNASSYPASSKAAYSTSQGYNTNPRQAANLRSNMNSNSTSNYNYSAANTAATGYDENYSEDQSALGNYDDSESYDDDYQPQSQGTGMTNYNSGNMGGPRPFNQMNKPKNQGFQNQSGGWPGPGFAKKGPGGPGNANMMSRPKPFQQPKPKPPPKPQQIHYCEVCKISCAGPQTYKEHLDGQKHKKKEAAAKVGVAAVLPAGGTALRCELCDVACTGADAYAAHIRGSKHQKVVKLHTSLGKPIPSTEPVMVVSNTATSPGKAAKKAATVANTKSNVETKTEDTNDKSPTVTQDTNKLDIQPVGEEYVEEIKNDDGKVVNFQCKLCDCQFNDPNAKEMHLKGRRHRLQYKKKVNPELVIENKSATRQQKILDDKLRRQQIREEFWRKREGEIDDENMNLEERRRYEEEMEYFEWSTKYGRDPQGMASPLRPFVMQPITGNARRRRPDSSDDRHVLAKHTQIYPNEEELQAVQKIVSDTEKALKLVSDFLTEMENPKKDVPPAKTTPEDVSGNDKSMEATDKEDTDDALPRILKGVMRVGVLAKGLLLHGDLNVELVVLCSDKPTRTLLWKVADNLQKQFATLTDEKYVVKCFVDECALLVTATTDIKTSVTITLTSPVMRDANLPDDSKSATAQDPPDVLNKEKCLDALAALRHAKWFRARANGLQSCVMIIRILRDLCQRVPTWTPLNTWAMELFCEKVISSAGMPLSPGDALKRVFEALSSGILLPGGPGLLDPCEKEPIDVIGAVTNQEREDITASAQHAQRLLAFRQIHKVLGMDQLPPPKFTRGRFNRKRKRDNESGEGTEDGADGKKNKDDALPMEVPQTATDTKA